MWRRWCHGPDALVDNPADDKAGKRSSYNLCSTARRTPWCPWTVRAERDVIDSFLFLQCQLFPVPFLKFFELQRCCNLVRITERLPLRFNIGQGNDRALPIYLSMWMRHRGCTPNASQQHRAHMGKMQRVHFCERSDTLHFTGASVTTPGDQIRSKQRDRVLLE